jgi:S1-C subfamily serine protease
MRKRNFAIMFFTLLSSLLIVFMISACSFMGITIEPPKIYFETDEQYDNGVDTRQLEESKDTRQADTPISENISVLEQQKESNQEILASFDEAISNVTEKVKLSVVNIKVIVRQRDLRGREYSSEGVGSGVIFSNDGYIITNNHVVKNAEELVVTLSDGAGYAAQLVGGNDDSDIAVIKIEAIGLKPAEFTSIENIRVGQLAIAIGSPYGLKESVTVGVISAIGRDVLTSYDSMPFVDLIQTDAAVNPGNSGGALLNSAGQVLGINTMIYSTTGSNTGIGFAIPSDIAVNIANQIIESGTAKTPYIGIEMGENPTDIKGVYIAGVQEGYPAQQAGIKTGDIITEFNYAEVESPYELLAQILRHRPEDTVSVILNRDGESIEVSLTLVEKPQEGY